MSISNNEAIDMFEKASKPLMDYLKDNHHPHKQAVVTSESAELLESQIYIKREHKLELNTWYEFSDGCILFITKEIKSSKTFGAYGLDSSGAWVVSDYWGLKVDDTWEELAPIEAISKIAKLKK